MRFEKISMTKNELPNDAIIYWTIYADNADKKTGQLHLADIKSSDF